MSNRTFVIIFSAMMLTIMYLSGCTYLQSEREPMKLLCTASCDKDGACRAQFSGIDEVMTTSTEANLDTPTQTRVGMTE